MTPRPWLWHRSCVLSQSPGVSRPRERPDATQAKSKFLSPTFPAATHERSHTNHHARTKVASRLFALVMVVLVLELSTGCARYYWSKAGGTAEQFDRENTERTNGPASTGSPVSRSPVPA